MRRRRGDRWRVHRRESHLLRAIPDLPPRGEAERDRQCREAEEDRAPRCQRHHPRERRAGDHRAQVAGEHRDAVQRREPARRKPHGAHLEDRDERDRHADADERAPGSGDFPGRRERERDRAQPRDDRAGGQDPPRPERVGEHADRDLQHRVNVEIRRGERAQHRAVDGELACQLGGNGRRRRAVEEREHEARERDAEDHAAGADEAGVGQWRGDGGMPHCTGAPAARRGLVTWRRSPAKNVVCPRHRRIPR